MTIDRKELKTEAKSKIKGNVAVFFGLSIIMGIILSISGITVVGPLILMGPLSLGLSIFMLEVVRTGKSTLESGFKGFKQFGTSFGAGLLMIICTCLWSLLFYIPGIIAAIRYSMTFYIIADNPELSATEAIDKSKEMMKGHKGEFFVLLLSFFWWYILCFITFGLAAIYVSPYIEATKVAFYEKIKLETSNN